MVQAPESLISHTPGRGGLGLVTASSGSHSNKLFLGNPTSFLFLLCPECTLPLDLSCLVPPWAVLSSALGP